MDDILFLAHRIPYPPNKGDKLRSYHLLQALCARYRVHLGCFVDDRRDWAHTETLSAVCASTYFAPQSRVSWAGSAIAAVARGTALTPAIYRHRGLAAWVREVTEHHRPICAYVYSSAMAQFVAPHANLRRVMDFVDVDSEKWRQRAAHAPWPLSGLYRHEAAGLLIHDRAVAQQFDRSVFVSTHEADRFRQLAPEIADKVVVLPNGVDADYFDPSRDYDRPDTGAAPYVVFTGALDYWPNEDAVIWFADHVLPIVQQTAPGLRFVVAGRDPSHGVRRLGARPDIDVVANPSDMRPWLAHAAAVVVPLRDSPGVANKVLEGLAMARPVIATPQAISGISVEPGRDLLVAGSAAEFARALITVLQDGELASRLGRAGRAYVAAHYRWDAGLAALPQLIAGDVTGHAATNLNRAPAADAEGSPIDHVGT